MEIKTNETGKERIILIGMILSKRFLREVSFIFETSKNCFTTKHTKLISKWCWEYWQKYQRPPGKHIQDIYEEEKDSLPEGTAELVEEFLISISNEYQRVKKFNVGYAIDIAKKYFRRQSIQNLKDDIEDSLAIKNIDRAEDLIAQHTNKIIVSSDISWVNPLEPEEIRRTFAADEKDFLMRMPGAFGEMLGDIEREFLIGILGKTGIGKTFMLMFFGLFALFSGFNVFFVNLELSRNQLKRRIYHYLTGLPPDNREGKIFIPVLDCKQNQLNTCNKSIRKCEQGLKGLTDDDKKMKIFTPNEETFKKNAKGFVPCIVCRNHKKFKNDYKPAIWLKFVYRKPISQEAVNRRVDNLLKCNITRGGQFRILTCPSGTLTITELRKQARRIGDYEGLAPDLIITDYADKFKGEFGKERFEIKSIWEGHKALGQEFHSAVITGSQSSAARSEKDTKHYDWAEASFKKDLIDLGIMLNQSNSEKQIGVLRASVAKHRHEEFNFEKQALILQSLVLGRPYLESEKI